MSENPDTLTIGGLAGQAGVNVETVRFYQRKGLLAQPPRAHGSIARYTTGDLSRIRFIKSAQRLGFSLDEVAELLRLEDGTHCADARQLASRKLFDVRERLDDLTRIEAALTELVGRCGSSRKRISCPLIEALRQS